MNQTKIELHQLGDSLNEAHKTITGDRLDTYGAPEDCFQLIAEYWSAYLKRLGINKCRGPIVEAVDVAHMMILLKVARCSGQAPCRDNYIDIQGYAAITADTLLNQE